MGEDAEDSVELELASKEEAIKFVAKYIFLEAETIEVVKHTTGPGYTGKATGLL